MKRDDEDLWIGRRDEYDFTALAQRVRTRLADARRLEAQANFEVGDEVHFIR